MPLLLAFDENAQRFDLVRSGGNFVPDAGLQTAVAISLFTDAQPEAEDLAGILAKGGTRRGWWADVYLPGPIGSRLWVVLQKGNTTSAARDAEKAAKDALQWMVDDGVAKDVSATASAQTDFLSLAVTITKPDGKQWANQWKVPYAVD